MEGADAAPGFADHTTWEQLPDDVQQRILQTAMPSVRRVSRGVRDAFDAVNQKLHIVSADGQRRQAIAKAAVLRVLQRSHSLTAVTLPKVNFVTLTDLTATATTGLATRLRNITGLRLDVSIVPEQPRALQQCTGLVHLDISNSRVCDLGPQQRLEGAAALAAALQGTPNLTYLDLNGCRLGAEGATALASALQTLTKLQHLHVAGNYLGSSGLQTLALALSATPRLQTLGISGNDNSGEQGAEALRVMLSNAAGLTRLDISWSGLEPQGAVVLAPVLQGMVSLQHLQLQGNALRDAGVAVLAPALIALPKMHTLDLRYNHLGEGAVLALQPLFAKQGSPLRTLDLSSNPFRAVGACALAGVLRATSQLQSLSLMWTQMGAQGMASLAASFGALAPTLNTLQLGEDRRGCAGSIAMIPALQALTGLTSLHVSWRTEPEGATHVASALVGMRRLQVLNLTDTPISQAGAAALAQVLPLLAGSLERLYLLGCKMGSQGAQVLAPGLAQTTGLVELHLGRNDLQPDAVNALASALRAMRSLHCLWVQNNQLDGHDYLCMARAMQGRDSLPSLYITPSSTSGGSHEAEWDELLSMENLNVLVEH